MCTESEGKTIYGCIKGIVWHVGGMGLIAFFLSERRAFVLINLLSVFDIKSFSQYVFSVAQHKVRRGEGALAKVFLFFLNSMNSHKNL